MAIVNIDGHQVQYNEKEFTESKIIELVTANPMLLMVPPAESYEKKYRGTCTCKDPAHTSNGKCNLRLGEFGNICRKCMQRGHVGSI